MRSEGAVRHRPEGEEAPAVAITSCITCPSSISTITTTTRRNIRAKCPDRSRVTTLTCAAPAEAHPATRPGMGAIFRCHRWRTIRGASTRAARAHTRAPPASRRTSRTVMFLWHPVVAVATPQPTPSQTPASSITPQKNPTSTWNLPTRNTLPERQAFRRPPAVEMGTSARRRPVVA